jgi:hypothetical protein
MCADVPDGVHVIWGWLIFVIIFIIKTILDD